MTRPLPPNPTLKHLRNEAKAIRKALKAADRKACPPLRCLNRFAKATDEEILAADIPLKEVQFALAMDYGFKSWAEMKRFVESLEIMRSGGLPLAKGASLRNWAINNPQDVKLDGDTWVFTGKDVRAEVGGMSWDNYVLSADVQVVRTTPDGTYRVQLTGRGTSIYCQLVPGWIVIAYFEEQPKDNPKGFTHLARREFDVPEGKWVNFRMKAEAGTIAAFLDGQEIVSARIPCGTQGMPGLLVNGQQNAEVRVRNIRVEFLRPTPEQVIEYGAGAGANWERYVAEHGGDMPDARVPGTGGTVT